MVTLLKERSTYWVLSGGSSANSTGDYRCYWKIYYEQSEEDKKLLRTKLIIDYYLQFSNSVGGNITYDASTTSKAYINGSNIGDVSISFTTIGTTGLIKKGSKTTYVYHNEDGTGSFTFRGTGFGLSTSTTTYSLPKINRGTTISNNTSANNYIDCGKTVTFSLTKPNTSDNNYLYYKVGNTTYTIEESTNGNSVDYSFPVSLISNYPNNSEILLIVYCRNLTSNIETSTIVYLKVPDTYIPNISLAISEVGDVPTSWEIWVKGKSKIKGVITAKGVSESTIKSYSSSANNATYNTQSFETDYLKSNGSQTIKSTVVDSRGRSNNDSETINVIDYFAPSYVSVEVKRCLKDGTLDETNGTYAKIVCEYKIAPCSNKNEKTLVVTCSSQTKTFELSNYEATITAGADMLFSDINLASSYTFEFKLIDTFNTDGIKYGYKLSPAYTTVSKRAGGKGITFGQVATENGFHDYMGARFHNGLQVDGDLKVGSAFTIDPTNSFQTTIFGSNNNGYRLRTIRSGITTNSNFPQYGSGMAFSSGDTHGFLFTKYNSEGAWIGAGSKDKLNWMNQIQFKNDKVLYENSSGSNGTITLSETSANFKDIDIFYFDDSKVEGFIRVHNPNGKVTSLQIIENSDMANYYMNIKNKMITISGTTIIPKSSRALSITSSGSIFSIDTTDKIKIWKVVGHAS